MDEKTNPKSIELSFLYHIIVTCVTFWQVSDFPFSDLLKTVGDTTVWQSSVKPEKHPTNLTHYLPQEVHVE